MRKKLVLSVTVVLLLLYGITFFSCSTLINLGVNLAVAGVQAGVEDGKHVSNLKKEAAITGGRGIKWRSELAYEESKNKDMDSTGLWYIVDIPIILQNLSVDSQYNGIAVMHSIQNKTYTLELALVESNDNPAGEESSITVKKLGEPNNTTWTIKYVLSVDGKSFNITDLGGLYSPPLRVGQYLTSDARKDANVRALEGYGSFTVTNINSNYFITQININGGRNRNFTQTYQVNLSPAARNALGMLGGGSFEVGDVIAGKKVIPIGDYELTLVWSNGVRTTHKVTITSSGLIGNYNQ